MKSACCMREISRIRSLRTWKREQKDPQIHISASPRCIMETLKSKNYRQRDHCGSSSVGKLVKGLWAITFTKLFSKGIYTGEILYKRSNKVERTQIRRRDITDLVIEIFVWRESCISLFWGRQSEWHCKGNECDWYSARNFSGSISQQCLLLGLEPALHGRYFYLPFARLLGCCLNKPGKLWRLTFIRMVYIISWNVSGGYYSERHACKAKHCCSKKWIRSCSDRFSYSTCQCTLLHPVSERLRIT